MKKSEIRQMIREELGSLQEADYSELVKMVKDLTAKLKTYKVTDKVKAKEAKDAIEHLNSVLDMR